MVEGVQMTTDHYTIKPLEPSTWDAFGRRDERTTG